MIRICKTWKQCTEQTILNLFEQVKQRTKELYPEYFEKVEPKLLINSSKRNLGQCRISLSKSFKNAKQVRDSKKVEYTDGVILLSKFILHDKDKIIEVLCHEFGHYVTPARNHDNVWKEAAANIGSKWKVTVSRLDNSGVLIEGRKKAGANIENYKYLVGCTHCNISWSRKRMSNLVKNPENYICPICGQELTRIQ